MKYQFMVFDDATLKRFWSKVDKRGQDDCWPWYSSVGRDGYGKFFVKKKFFGAHRASLIINSNILNKDLCALHSCDNRLCVNPNHLRWGTISDNTKDKYQRNKKTRWEKRKLNASQVIYIKKLHKSGFSMKKCAGWYCVDYSVIKRIISGKTYKEINLS